MIKKVIPERRVFFLPIRSESLPIGSRRAVTVKEKAITTQETSRRVTAKSRAISGRARIVMFILITIVKMESATAKKAFHWYEIEIFTSQIMDLFIGPIHKWIQNLQNCLSYMENLLLLNCYSSNRTGLNAFDSRKNGSFTERNH